MSLNNLSGTLALVALLTVAFAARAVDVDYTVSVRQPTSQLIDVTMHIRGAAAGNLDVAMPMWTPGGYGPVWFARNVQEFRAEDARGARLKAQLTGTSQWSVTKGTGDVRLHYRVYIADHRGSPQIDEQHFRLNGIATLMYVVGQAPYPAPGAMTLRIEAPDGWQIATGLDERSPRVFTAPDYDTLADAPVMMARELELWTFEDHGARYEIWLRNPHNYDRDAFTSDVRRVVAEQAEMMRGVPFRRYAFLMTGINTRGGGLEHSNSTTISFKRYDEPASPEYRRLQFLVAHEFFHLWNVKRIRPEILGPFDYSKPQHSKNIYIAEGMTDYYGYLTVARAGLWSHETFYAQLAEAIETLQKSPGRLIASVEEASWRTWTPHDNAAHAGISFYTKGSLIGLLLDLEIRSRTQGRKSLDDVFRYLLLRHGLPKPGFDEDRGFQDAVETVTAQGGGARDFSRFFADYVAGVADLDYNRFLAHVGLRLEITEDRTRLRPSLEMETTVQNDQFIVSGLTYQGAAYRAGVMKNDVLLMLDGERFVTPTLDARLKSIGVGGQATLQVLRGDRLVRIPIILGEDRPVSYRIVEDDNATRQQKAARAAWLAPYATSTESGS